MRSSDDIRRELAEIPDRIEEAAGRGDFAGVQQAKIRAQELQRECLEAGARDAEQVVQASVKQQLEIQVAGKGLGLKMDEARSALQAAQERVDELTRQQAALSRTNESAQGAARRGLGVAISCRRAMEEHSQLVAAEVLENELDPGLKNRVYAALRGEPHEDYVACFGHSSMRFNGVLQAMRATGGAVSEAIEKLLERGVDFGA